MKQEAVPFSGGKARESACRRRVYLVSSASFHPAHYIGLKLKLIDNPARGATCCGLKLGCKLDNPGRELFYYFIQVPLTSNRHRMKFAKLVQKASISHPIENSRFTIKPSAVEYIC